MNEDFRTWWHRRTDDVEGIDKLIGAKGSMFRENIVKPALVLLGILVLIFTLKR